MDNIQEQEQEQEQKNNKLREEILNKLHEVYINNIDIESINAEEVLTSIFDKLKNFDKNERIYEEFITYISDCMLDIEREKNGILFEDILNKSLNSEDIENIVLPTLYILNVYYRHKNDIDGIKNLRSKIDKSYNDNYKDFPILRHIKALTDYTINCDHKVLKDAEKNCDDDKIGKNIGVRHLFASIVADYYGNKDYKINKDHIKKALNCCDDAINENPKWAMFYNTRAKLLKLQGEYELAAEAILNAISYEDVDKTVYNIHMKAYWKEYFNMQNHLQSRILKKQKALEKKQLEIENTQIKNIEILAFFSGMISFIIGSINMVNPNYRMDSIIKFMIIFTGSLLVSFSCFGIVIRNFSSIKKGILIGEIIKYSCIILIGSALIIFGAIY